MVAAKLLGKKFIGIDISKEYIHHAEQRLENAFLEKNRVEEEEQKHIVKKTFKQRKEEGGFTGRHGVNYKMNEALEIKLPFLNH